MPEGGFARVVGKCVRAMACMARPPVLRGFITYPALFVRSSHFAVPPARKCGARRSHHARTIVQLHLRAPSLRRLCEARPISSSGSAMRLCAPGAQSRLRRTFPEAPAGHGGGSEAAFADGKAKRSRQRPMGARLADPRTKRRATSRGCLGLLVWIAHDSSVCRHDADKRYCLAHDRNVPDSAEDLQIKFLRRRKLARCYALTKLAELRIDAESVRCPAHGSNFSGEASSAT